LPQHPRRGRRAQAQLLGCEARPKKRFPDQHAIADGRIVISSICSLGSG
jgi:hypothetical protein